MHDRRSLALGVALVALLAAGCGKPHGLTMPHLDPEAPAASGLPPRAAPNQPIPLTERPPFGLYADPPTSATLLILASGSPSPDGRFRAALTSQGAWVARTDAAWLWQVQIPQPAPPPTPGKPGAPGQPATPATGSTPATPGQPSGKPATPVVPSRAVAIQWTARSTLLLQDDKGQWLEAVPNQATVTPLAAALQGKSIVDYSPDGKQILYYVNDKNGRQLWLANPDGSKPTLLGVNVVGSFDSQGKPVVLAVQGPPVPPPRQAPTTPPVTTTPPATSQPPVTTTPPATSQPPVTTRPPATTQPPTTTQPPAQTQP